MRIFGTMLLVAWTLLLSRRAGAWRGWALAGLAMAAAAFVQGTRPPAVSTHEMRLASRRRASAAGADFVGAALAGRPPGAVVLLSHSPLQLERAAAAGAGLVLSGHAHGGQIWPFGYLVRISYPQLAGRYQVGGAMVIVGRGTGTWGPRMRLWQRGEILRVVLRAA